MKKCLLIIVAILILAACAPSPEAISQAVEQTLAAQSTNIKEPTNTSTLLPTKTSAPTRTLGPTNTPKPTNTPRPTSTSRPTVTSTPEPNPIFLSGSGDGVVDVNKWSDVALLHVVGPDVHDNFIVQNYDGNGEQIDLLVNTIGAYDGYQMIDLGDEKTARFQVESSGDWVIELYPFSKTYVHTLSLPGSYTGNSDDVFVLLDGKPDLAKITAGPGEDNFAVFSLGVESGRELVVNEISPYSGTVIIPQDAFIIIVNASVPWTMDISAR